MIVSEIFTSIQGESSLQGIPFTFVRLTGCNLRCAYCDTTYAYYGGRVMDPMVVSEEVKKAGFPRVLITGGEPLLQDDTPLLADLLIRRGYSVTVETNGSLPISRISGMCGRIVDVKTPGSGEGSSFLEENISHLGDKDEVKFVLTDREDFAFARAFIDEKLIAFKGKILVSPAHGTLEPKTLARWMIEEKFDVRLNLQLHKFIFGEHRRGV